LDGKVGKLDAMCLPVANWTLWLPGKKSTTTNVVNLVTPRSAKRSRARFWKKATAGDGHERAAL
jgi:hypothetical protein